ncbi:MAG: T9SS type A sorting domain-containing protein [Lewinellaceae bacterium]|nr:T9SS type A sorting domain-containing protein [Lewinellaceae bacterium]
MPAPEAYFDFDIHQSVGTKEAADVAQLLRIFPNPACSITCVPVWSKWGGAAMIEVVDVGGRTVSTVFDGNLPSGESNHFIFADRLENGVYFIILQSQNSRQVQRFVVFHSN